MNVTQRPRQPRVPRQSLKSLYIRRLLRFGGQEAQADRSGDVTGGMAYERREDLIESNISIDVARNVRLRCEVGGTGSMAIFQVHWLRRRTGRSHRPVLASSERKRGYYVKKRI